MAALQLRPGAAAASAALAALLWPAVAGGSGAFLASRSGVYTLDWAYVRRGHCSQGWLENAAFHILPFCADHCREVPRCEYFAYSFQTKSCALFTGMGGCQDDGAHHEQGLFHMNRSVPAPPTLPPAATPVPPTAPPAPTPAPPLPPPTAAPPPTAPPVAPPVGPRPTPPLATIEQAGARIPAGGTLRVFVVGSSNAQWQTWADQVHVLLEQLGYQSPLVQGTELHNTTQPQWSATCDDAKEISDTHTLRIATPGWSSWGFAYDSMDGCSSAGYREIDDYAVRCVNGWQCLEQFSGSEALVRPSDIAAIARGSELTILHNWVNDFTARFHGSHCFGPEVPSMGDADLTIDSLRRTIRAISAASPGTTIAVMAKYPGAGGRVVGCEYKGLNRAVQEALADEPNTIFVDYDFPLHQDMFLMSKSGHANCRGDKVMAKAVVGALYDAKVIARGLAMGNATQCLGNAQCEALSPECCQASALCWPLADGRCAAYSTGE